jgi:hypothetical protein
VKGDISALVQSDIGVSIKQSVACDQMPDMNCEGEQNNMRKVSDMFHGSKLHSKLEV